MPDAPAVRLPGQVDVVVIGGGLAGLAAAARLKERGVQALVLEADDELGGKLRAVSPNPHDVTLSRGPIVWEARRENVTRLMHLLGLGDDVIATLPVKARYVLRGGKLCALQPHPVSILTTKALTLRDRAHLLREPLLPRGAVRDDESLARFFRRRFGHDVAEGLLFAMANGIWAGDPERLSAAVCFPDMVAAERDHGSVLVGTVKRLRAAARAKDSEKKPKGSLTLKRGLGSVGAAAAAVLQTRTGVRVSALEQRAQDVLVRTSAGDVVARAVVVAVEAHAARHLLTDKIVDSILCEVTYSTLALVHWRERKAGESRLPKGFGWLAPPRERSFSLGALFASDMLPSLGASSGAPQTSRRVFSSFVGGLLAPEKAHLTDAELERNLAQELGRLTGGRFGDVLHIERAAHAVAQPTLGHSGRMARLQESLAQSRVAVAGSWLGAGAMKDAVDSGFNAADDVATRLARDPVRAPVRDALPQDVKVPTGAASGVVPKLHVVISSERETFNDDVIEPGRESNDAREKRVGQAPFAVVGASYRDVATEVRAKLAALERGADAPSHALVEAGYAEGVVFLETCSRVEWLISSTRPAWAAEILKSTLARRVPDSRVHTKTGHAGAHYLLRVAMGLDSVAEGEPAVGRQLVLAFEKAHKDGAADRSLRLAWRGVQQLMGERRRRGVVRHGLGVQTLVIEELAAKGIAKSDDVLVFGQGEIGRAVSSALKDAGYTRALPHRRSTQLQFLAEAEKARAVVVCTGGPAPFVELPARAGSTHGALVIDIGVPTQVKSAPGWTQVMLEDLLMQPRRMLDDETRAWLVDQVEHAADRLSKDLADPVPATALSAIDEARRIFLRETLPPLLEKLPNASAEEVRRACVAFAHNLMERVRDGNGPTGGANGGGANGGGTSSGGAA